MSEITPGMIVVHSHRLEELTDLVVGVTQRYPLQPLETETVLVQSNGIAQWLKLHVAQTTGIASMLEVTLPARFQWRAYRAVLGDQLPTSSPFDKNRLTWRIFRILPQHLAEPEFAVLQRYMKDDSDQRKLLQLSQRLADLYDQYQMYRADWLDNWADGSSTDVQVDADDRWQPLLWRYLLADVGDQRWNNRATLHREFIQAAQQLTAASRPKNLPRRVIIFGISSLPEQLLELFNALSSCVQVILCVHNPCAEHWSHIVDNKRILEQEGLHAEANPLLAAWGKQGRDYIRLLELADESAAVREQLNYLKSDIFPHSLPPQPSVLNMLQDDILHLRSVAESQQQWPQLQQPQAMQFHCAHSPQREVEVLHDQLLAWFAEDETLQPRDVMVMVPDINLYAPHIDAVFGRIERSDPRFLPYTIADQGQRHRHPILIALDYVLAIRQQRATASDIIDLLQVPAVAAKLGLAEQHLPLLQRWIEQAGIRWGLAAEHRTALGLPSSDSNSWMFGLRRMLLGYATGATPLLNSEWLETEPYADVAGLEAEAAGALLLFIDRLLAHFNAAEQPRTPLDWTEYLAGLLTSLFVASSDADEILLQRLRQQLEQWLQACDEAGFMQTIPLTVVTESWLSEVDQPQLNQRFLAGSVNVATLMPMRAIPFKVVCLLGMNDGDYPRSQKPVDFDLMARDFRPGDRSRREDDRYLFLEALLSARERFYVSWHGRSIRDNSEKPPSVLVSQLLEHLQRLWGPYAWVQEHKLQPFSRAYFKANQPQYQQWFTFAEEWQVVHSEPTDTLNQPIVTLPPFVQEGELTVSQLTDFFKEPAKLLMNLRFGVYLREQQLTAKDDECFVLDGLSRWQLTQEALTAVHEPLLQSADAGHCHMYLQLALARLQRQGNLPQGAAGELMKQDIAAQVQAIIAQAQPLLTEYKQPVPVQTIRVQSTELTPPLTVSETFQGLRQNHVGERLHLILSPSKLVHSIGKELQPRLKHAVRCYLEHLLLNTAAPTQTFMLGPIGGLSLAPLPTANAQVQLQNILAAVAEGLTRPLPLELETAAAGLVAHHKTLANMLNAEQLELEHDDAEEAYQDGNRTVAALVTSKRYVARFYPTYAELVADQQMLAWVKRLYLPWFATLTVIGHGNEGDTGESE
ncbi:MULTISPECIES: exodeoxyribonuclease V subunit gamma [Idiomarina]|uniref:exodeoxyribonuclease V subunit gamma n=1 Tax=Idiomarinaceae TaxID=267893 RepID=UPI00129CB6A9|nr:MULTISPECIES: exodeoxyribonuclease V subunit gamma [Idiomarina]MRJ42612.1 exodeoxyribonuclease V subunit gamma [Idiomarina sp. FeN1]NCU57968.1 exodeoxyribonuclease V subunit gamma [Idiomarina sp. FenA--70]NCU60520.1 exodeoxyribonuclease V subunit gamma [Idiomarina sp. FenBw--71]UUN13609.1 exodeoxyribonuclease V subunit gamma [Idiomarina loihiensis]